MKKIIFSLLLLIISFGLSAQYSVPVYAYPTTTTPFGKTIPQYSVVVNQASPYLFYMLNTSQASTRTLAQAISLGQAVPIPNFGSFSFSGSQFQLNGKNIDERNN